jgi:N-methylhydantoinase A
MSTRIGVDIGGTFTDLVLYDPASGEVSVCKVPTVPRAPEEGCLNAVDKGVSRELLRSADYFLHGTTVGLNALLERRGAVVGLLVTEGFRDLLEIGRGGRGPVDPLFWRMPPPLVPRHLRIPVRGRIKADGDVYKPLQPDDIAEAARIFKEEGVTSVAIAFINAYANPEHERQAERLLREAGFEGGISLSHRVSGEYREYERTTTTVVDAFVRGRMAEYVGNLGAGLRERGFTGDGLITRSGSGSMTFEEASDRPFETIMSGPVAGAEGAAELSRALGLGSLVTADVGGTSFDACLIVNGRPELLHEGHIIGLPLQTPWVDVRSVGSGGGSIAAVDEGGLLRVGPESAGADPGPACYGRGGTRATMTDAALHLGMLGHGVFESGLVLDKQAAAEALQPLVRQLGRGDAESVAQGIMHISASAMANAIRELTIEKGIDAAGLAMLAFGGGGPLMACMIARELNITRIIVPPHAGNFSAWGLLGADITSTRARTRLMPLVEENVPQMNALLDELFAELADSSAGQGDAQMIVAADIRYSGQEHSLTVEIPNVDGRISVSAAEIGKIYAAKYMETFGGYLDILPEVVSLRATRRRQLPRRSAAASIGRSGDRATDSCKSYSFDRREVMDFPILHRSTLGVADVVEGPAIIQELTTTTYLDAGFRATVHESGCLILEPKA